ncbi:MAG: type II toxin-antitoxin system RelE/ParE family toxin [Lachnospiraceae bacterium]|nr:type II toxin-antitoxin system RelE/ParE family toxin [Lachnospiraceae bacterium]
MNEYKITLTPKAQTDLIEINNYISYILLSPDTSKQFIKGLKKSISSLSFSPYRFPIIQNRYFQQLKIRCMPYKNYYIFYEIDELNLSVNVLRVGYNKRNWEKLF